MGVRERIKREEEERGRGNWRICDGLRTQSGRRRHDHYQRVEILCVHGRQNRVSTKTSLLPSPHQKKITANT